MSELILPGFLQHELMLDALRAASHEFCANHYESRISALSHLPGDGIARHTHFTRSFANHVQHYGLENKISFYDHRKKLEGLDNIGDLVVYEPYKGQVRFSAVIDSVKYLLLHATGTINDNLMEVSGMGVARQEFFENQNKTIPKQPGWSLWERHQPEDLVADERAYRLLLVTEFRGPERNEFRLWVCVPDGNYDAKEGLLSLAEKHCILKDQVRNVAAAKSRPSAPSINTDAEQPSPFDFPVTPKEGEEDQGMGEVAAVV